MKKIKTIQLKFVFNILNLKNNCNFHLKLNNNKELKK